MLGPVTWKKMQPALASYPGPTVLMGPHPAWVFAIDAAANVRPGPKYPALSPNPKQSDVEDRVIREMAHVMIQTRDKPLLAVAVSPEYVARNGYPRGDRTLATNGPISQTLQVGQEWQGVEGKRLIVGLQSGGLSPLPGGGWGWDGSVLFLTASGQGYEQGVAGWESDLQARVYADAAEKMKPLQKMLDTEVAFLIGAISAYSGVGAAVVILGNVGHFVLEHKDKLPYMQAALWAAWKLRSQLLKKMPTLFGVFAKVMEYVWPRLPAALDAKIIARLLGEMIVTGGKAVVAEGARTLLQIAMTVMKIYDELNMAVLRALPNVARNEVQAVKELIDTLRKFGVVLSEMEVKNLVAEILANQQELFGLIRELEAAVKKL
jgi:hypothetical protein